MASLLSVRLNKGDSPSLGFRLQGGKDFGTPLVIQKVNLGSPAEKAGLVAGDSVIKINNTDVFNLRHKDAQDVIVRAGPAFELTIQRGGSTWKPAVIPTGNVQSPGPVTKTSLAAQKGENIGAIGTGHNLSAKPFGPQLNGAVNGGPKLVNNQYNTPLKLYSEESIAETLSAQTEVLSTGALGVNFKKNDKNYDATNSAVYRMLQEVEKEPKAPEAEPSDSVVGLRHVSAPETKAAPANPQLPPGQNICGDCERLIVGVFVRIKDKNLHVECFKCSTCGTSLKNVGYYNINNKLYCDIHAKLAARNNPPAANLIPVAVPPGGRAPVNAISAALSSHSLPSPSPLSPRSNIAPPFQPTLDFSINKDVTSDVNLQNLNVTEPNSNSPILNNSTPLSFNRYLKKGGSFSSAPKPFSSVAAPNYNTPNYNSFPKSSAPLSPISTSGPPQSFSPASSAGRYTPAKSPGGTIFKGRSVNIIWPPPSEEPEIPATACPLYFPPPSQVVIKPPKRPEEMEEPDYIEQFQHHKLSLCSQEVSEFIERRSACECVETLSDVLQTQQLVDDVMKNRPPSPPPLPRKDSVLGDLPLLNQQENLKKPTDFQPNTIECQLKSQIENSVPKQWESPMVQALRTLPSDGSFTNIPAKRSSSALASALSIAPSEPFSPQTTSLFTPIPLPEFTEPYFPPEHAITVEIKEPKPAPPDTQFVKALRTAPERPFTPTTPVKKKPKAPADEFLKELPKPDKFLTMRDALTTASERPYTPLSVVSDSSSVCKEEEKIEIKNVQRPLKPNSLPESFQKAEPVKIQAPKPFPVKNFAETKEYLEEKRLESCQYEATKQEDFSKSITTEETESCTQDETYQGMYPLFKGFSCSFGNSSEHSQFSVEINTSPPIINVPKSSTTQSKVTKTEESKQEVKETKVVAKQAEEVVLKRPLPLATALHKAEGLPQYQVHLSENAEADLKLLERIESAKMKHEQQKSHESVEQKSVAVQKSAAIASQTKQSAPPQIKQTVPSHPKQTAPPHQKQPIIVIQGGEPQQLSFKPVCEDFRPSSSTFSPRPRSLTPSMINKPPPTLPYYQANLVAQHYQPALGSVFDPSSPAVSRTPSPCPDRIPSPFGKRDIRPKSPAEGPPPNPLKTNIVLPDPKIEQAKKSVGTFIPHHKDMLGNQLQNPKIEGEATMMAYSTHQKQDLGSLEIDVKTDALYESFGQRAESQSVQNDGFIQVQRKQVVTEEFEHSQKHVEVQKITHPFNQVNNPQTEVQGITGLHVTNPQKISSPFLTKHVPAPSPSCPIKHVTAASAKKPSGLVNKPVPVPDLGSAGGRQAGAVGVAPKRGRGVLNTASLTDLLHDDRIKRSEIIVNITDPKPIYHQVNIVIPLSVSPNLDSKGSSPRSDYSSSSSIAAREKIDQIVHSKLTNKPNCQDFVSLPDHLTFANTMQSEETNDNKTPPICVHCKEQILRGPFITALGKIWCPDHFICATPSCRRPLQDLGFVEERGQLFCEYCFEQYLAPPCSKCNGKIKGDCLKAIGKNFHPECFNCVYCGKLFGNNPFFLEDGSPYCEADWNELFTTKCFACGFPVEAGDRWVEALNNNYHSQCFNCTKCKKNLEGQSFFAKGGRPFCKNHAR